MRRAFSATIAALFLIMKGLPMTYNRDMQEDKPRIFDAADNCADRLKWRGRGQHHEIESGPAGAAVQSSWAVATDLADALARNGTAVSSGA